ncbi:MAG TPA: succinate dehydrogenase, partial [Bacteroidales bacterium]|nr:succinate dehydrogenase [Bacteroidales bacterium]
MLYSSITKKVIMAIAGLFLALFLCVHLCINLLLLKNDGGQAYRIASEFMSNNLIIKIFEIILFGGLFLHIIFGFIVSLINFISRPIRYVKRNRSQTSFMSKYMVHTGIIILIFLFIHFINFFFVKVGILNLP